MSSLRWLLPVILCAGAVALAAGCPPAAPAPVPPSPVPASGGPGASPGTPAPPVSGAPALSSERSVGTCSSGNDCAGGLCEGLGCGAGEGRCAPRERACTRDLVAFCGCDGITFRSSGSCPGRRYAYRGDCAAPRPVGEPCASPSQCASGICEGQGCGDAETGTCAAADRLCTSDMSPYCGCDGETFRTSSSCPGQRFAARGECE